MKRLVVTALVLLIATFSFAQDGITVRDRDANGTPTFITGKLGSLVTAVPSRGMVRTTMVRDMEGEWGGAARDFMRDNAGLFGGTGREEFVTTAVRQDDLGQIHVRVQEYLNGLRVVGADLVIHADAATGDVRIVNGRFVPETDLPTRPGMGSQWAIDQAMEDAGIDMGEQVGRPELSYVVNENGKAYLAWSSLVQYENEEGEQLDRVFADAISGNIVARHPTIHRALNRKTYHGNNGTILPGTLRISEGGALTGDVAIDAAHTGAGTTWNYYKARFNRDSYNGAGAQLTSTAHHKVNYNNAFWNGTQMVYGDGDGTTFIALSRSLDVCAHELTHAVTEREAGLVYSNESGALNEGMSDVFGASAEAYNDGAINSDTWKIGDEIYTPGTAGDALRYMNNPTQDGSSKDYYPERYTGTADNGGVHWNSGIANLAYYLLVQGGQHPRGKTPTVTVPALGMAQSEQIFYRALANYMTSTTNFSSARTHTAQAATDLYGATAAAAVHKAWDAVGVPGTPGGGGGTTTLNNGQQLTGLTASTGTWTHYKIVVPASQIKLEIIMSGGTGDGDLYVKRGAQPTSTSYDYRPYLNGNNETVTVTNPVAGDWFISIYAYTTYSGVSLKATYTAAAACTPYSGSLSGTGAQAYLPSSTGYVSSVSGTHTGAMTGTGVDFDLYLQKWNGSTWAVVAKSEGTTSTENVSYSGTAGTYRWRVYAYSGAGTYNLCTTKP